MPKVKIQKVKNVEKFLFKVEVKRQRDDTMKDAIESALHPPHNKNEVCKSKGCKLPAAGESGLCNMCFQFIGLKSFFNGSV